MSKKKKQPDYHRAFQNNKVLTVQQKFNYNYSAK